MLTADPGRQGHRHRELDLAGRRRRQPRAKPLVAPEDAKGMKVRGGSREMDMMLQGGRRRRHLTLPSNEIYAAMQTGAMDAAHDLVDQPHLVPARGSVEAPDHRPRQVLLVHVRAADDVEGRSSTSCRRTQQDAIMAVGAELGEVRHARRARPTTSSVAEVYAKAGAKVSRPRRGDARASGRRIAREHGLEGLRRRKNANCAEAAASCAEKRAVSHGVDTGQRRQRDGRATPHARRRCRAALRAARAHRACINRVMVVARHGRAARRVAGPHLQRRHALLPQDRDRLAGRDRGVLHRRRRLPVRRVRAGAARPRRHRGAGRAAAGRA